MADTLIGVTGDFVPARAVLNPLFLARSRSVSGTDVDPAKFRQLLGRFATGVVVITARDTRGRPTGMTANSLASVSLEPPLVSICVDHQAEMYHVMSDTDQFVVNILSSRSGDRLPPLRRPWQEDRFDGVGYQVESSGALHPRRSAGPHRMSRSSPSIPLGDHTMFVGRVIGGAASEDPAHSRPLLYYRGGYAALG